MRQFTIAGTTGLVPLATAGFRLVTFFPHGFDTQSPDMILKGDYDYKQLVAALQGQFSCIYDEKAYKITMCLFYMKIEFYLNPKLKQKFMVVYMLSNEKGTMKYKQVLKAGFSEIE